MNVIRLEKVNQDNVWDLLKLRVRPDQENFVADNTQSIVDAYLALSVGGCAFPFGIYEEETPVGFLMIGFGTENDRWEGEPQVNQGNYSLWRLMIDEKHQGRGYGKQAIRLALDFVKTFPRGPAEYCYLSYEPENEKAKALYHSFGFVENGEWDGDEIVAVLKLV